MTRGLNNYDSHSGLDQPDAQKTSNILTTALRNIAMPTDPYKYLKQYWIIVTTGAFLLVILVGEVTLFKVVFMIFFLLFIFAYEVSIQPVCVSVIIS